MIGPTFLAAFAGGLLSLLAPCSALLLPAFFAYAFTSPSQLLGRTLLFLAGTSTVFVPLGMGASVVGVLLIDYRETTVLVAGVLLIGFGLLELAGRGFSLAPVSLARWVPSTGSGQALEAEGPIRGADNFFTMLSARTQAGSGPAAAYGTGLVYGLTGFCSGPLVGGVLTLATTSPSPLFGATLLFTYSVGVAAPLFVIAWLWDRYQLGRRAWLRGRPLRLGPLHVFSTNLIAGSMLTLLGITLIAFQGSSPLSGLYEDLRLTDLGYQAEEWIEARLAQTTGAGWIGLALLFVCAIWFIRYRAQSPQTVKRSDNTPDGPGAAAPEHSLRG